MRKHASQKLKAAIDTALADLKRLEGKPLTAAFKALDALEAGARTKKTKTVRHERPRQTREEVAQESSQEGRQERAAFIAAVVLIQLD